MLPLRKTTFLYLLLLFGCSGVVYGADNEGRLFGQLLNPATDDLSLDFLGAIFGAMNRASPQTVFSALMAYFNVFVLNIALALLVFYGLIFSINVAASGEFIRRGSDGTFLLKVVIGLALLVSNPAGYSYAQIIFYRIVQAGVGVAGTVWATGLAYLDRHPLFLSPIDDLETVTNDFRKVDKHLQAVWRGLVCSYAANYSTSNTGGNYKASNAVQQQYQLATGQAFPSWHRLVADNTLSGRGPLISAIEGNYNTLTWLGPRYYEDTQSICFGYNGSNTCQYTRRQNTRVNTCGEIEIKASERLAYANLISSWAPAIADIVAAANNQHDRFSSLTVTEAVLTEIQQGISGFIADIKVGAAGQDSLLARYGPTGWVAAGFYYTHFFTGTPPPLTAGPSGVITQPLEPVYARRAAATVNTIYQAAVGYFYADAAPTATDTEIQATLDRLYRLARTGDVGTTGALTGLAREFDAGAAGSFYAPGDPFRAAVSRGSALMIAASALLIVYMATSTVHLLVSGACSLILPFGRALETFYLFVTTFLVVFIGAAYTQGALQAVLLPLIPSVAFIGGVIGWLFAVIEGMVAAPLVALGILWPGGQHPQLGKAEPAVMLVLNVFLRPGLMIIGFFCAMVLCWLTFRLIDLLMMTAWTNGIVQTEPIFGWLPLGFLYVALLIAVAKKSYALIYEIPDRVLMWLGAQQMSWGGGEDLLQALQQGSLAGAAVIGQLANRLQSNSRERQSAALDRDRRESEQGGGDQAIAKQGSGQENEEGKS